MKIHFRVEYKTQWGEELRIMLTQVKCDGLTRVRECPLETYDGLYWEGEITIQPKGLDHIEYKYALYNQGSLVWTEWEVAPHVIHIEEGITSYIADDRWRAIPEELPLFSSAYTDCVASHDINIAMEYYKSTLQLRVIEPRLRKDQYLAVVGNTGQLGNWSTPVKLNLVALQEWAVNLDAELLYNDIEYKYVIVNKDGHIVQWEDGQNRRVRCPKLAAKQVLIKTDCSPKFNINNWKCAGVVIPVFSIRTEQSYGIGDFGDLKQMIYWAAKTGMHAVQILPINDTTMAHTWQDSYPYNAISIYAFHPIYCNLNAVGKLDDKLKMETFMMKQQELNALPQIDYEAVARLKREYLALIYRQEGKKTLASKGFNDFFCHNEDWLVPYAAFSYLRDKYSTPDFSSWPSYSTYSKGDIDKLCSPESDAYEDIALHYFVQYHLHLQLLDVRNTARQLGVIIKGDIPIGISRNSVEAWTEPHYFNLNGQAGAPPDDFSVNGQNWGFPTYNWDVMEEDGCKWWLRRFGKMAEYFDAYRIDHVLGFFRIWEIPLDSVHGLLGQFSPALPMSVNEIESYGLKFNYELMTRPYISEYSLDCIFGYRKDLVKTLYLNQREDGRYDLKPEYDTQRKIEAAFKSKTDEDNISLRDGLYSLVSCVLFVVDRKFSTMYHPRISAQSDYIYMSLSDTEKQAFDNLYTDYFYRRHNQFWYEQAMNKLPMLTQATRMLVCAEDLGMVPDCVPWIMNQLRMLSLEIQSMPKTLGLEFGKVENNPYRSVATISTHDMSTLRLWWEEDAARAQKFYNHALYKDGQAPQPLPGWLAEDIINRHLFSPSMLCLLSLQDWLAMDEELRYPDTAAERINIPANPRHYWRYRMHLSVEQLMKSDYLNKRIKTLIGYSGRLS